VFVFIVTRVHALDLEFTLVLIILPFDMEWDDLFIMLNASSQYLKWLCHLIYYMVLVNMIILSRHRADRYPIDVTNRQCWEWPISEDCSSSNLFLVSGF
jgi:hypothetical protein